MIKGPQLRAFLKHSLAILPVFYITELDCGHSFYAAEFATLEDAEFALDQLHNALEDCHGSNYSIRCAIAELEEQIAEHKLDLIADIICP